MTRHLNLKHRRLAPEILDDPSVPEAAVRAAYRELAALHRLLGIRSALFRLIRSHRPRPTRILDIGCGDARLLCDIERRLKLSVVGVDKRPLEPSTCSALVLGLDATIDRLPKSDIALAVLMTHHLRDDQVIRLIRNAGASSKRLVIVDLVRHWLPRFLFRLLVAPWVSGITVQDGLRSFERAFTPGELQALGRRATAGTKATQRHTAGWFRTWQLLDIQFLADQGANRSVQISSRP
jgi:SAM-dependent methyltransferase